MPDAAEKCKSYGSAQSAFTKETPGSSGRAREKASEITQSVFLRRITKALLSTCRSTVLSSLDGVAELCQIIHDRLQQVLRTDRSQKLRSQTIQMSLGDDLNSKTVHDTSTPKNESPNVFITDFATPASDVSAFCRAVLYSLIPHGFWGVGKGADANQKIIMQHVDRFIHLRRFENLSLHLVSQKLKVGGNPQQMRLPH